MQGMVGHSSCVLRAIYVCGAERHQGDQYVDKLLTPNNRTLPSPVDDLFLEL